MTPVSSVRPPALLQVLLVEDDPLIAHTLGMGLRFEGFSLIPAASIKEAQEQLARHDFDILLLDIGLPDGDGISLCKKLRQSHPGTAILIISALSDEHTVVTAFDVGADDYMRKPFGLQELSTRMRRQHLLRQTETRQRNSIAFGSIQMDRGRRTVSIAGTVLQLGKKEFDVLFLLVQAGGDTITRQQILTQFDGDSAIYDRTIDSHLSHLRRKLKDAGADERIVAIYGVGYKLELVGSIL